MIKMKNILLEKKELDSTHIEKISKMTDRNDHLGARTYLSYLLGGTIGNGIDRLFKGFVLDFLELVPINFPIFNVADISINIAVILILIENFTTRSKIEK